MPPKERSELAMRLNALAASPSFAAWGRGPALDPRVLLRTEDGKPRAAVVYLATSPTRSGSSSSRSSSRG